MGCASSSKDKALEKDHLLEHPRAEAASKDWLKDIRDIWNRGFESLPVHSDVPRLARKMRIVDSDGSVLQNGRDCGSVTVQELVLQLLVVLSEKVETAEFVETLQAHYREYVKEEGDFSQQLLTYLREVVGTSNVGRILKACHQRVIFPGYYNMKALVYNDCPFKDSRGSWEVDITFLKDKSIQITHRKAQVSQSDWHSSHAEVESSSPLFSFTWALDIYLAPDLSELTDASLTIINLHVEENVDREKRKKIESVIVPNERVC